MHEACLSRVFLRVKPPPEGPSSPFAPPPRFVVPPPPTLAATTLVHCLFGGVLRSQVRCCRCGYESNTYEPCIDVSLDVVSSAAEGAGNGDDGSHHHHHHHHHHRHGHRHRFGGNGGNGGWKKHKHNSGHHHHHHLASHASAPPAATLLGSLARFTAGERLEGDNAYACPGCRERNARAGAGGDNGSKKSKSLAPSSSSPPAAAAVVRSPAVKRITLHSTPRVLVLQLKRFEYHAAGRKISKKVDFGTELDVAPFTSAAADAKLLLQSSSSSSVASKKRKPSSSEAQEQEMQREDAPQKTRYRLCGVLVHSGHSVHSGHYTALARAGDGLWHSFDDDAVSQVSERVVLAQRAYILFYVRCDDDDEDAEGDDGEKEEEQREGEEEARREKAAAAAVAALAPPVPPLSELLPNGNVNGALVGGVTERERERERRSAMPARAGAAGEGAGGGAAAAACKVSSPTAKR